MADGFGGLSGYAGFGGRSDGELANINNATNGIFSGTLDDARDWNGFNAADKSITDMEKAYDARNPEPSSWDEDNTGFSPWDDGVYNPPELDYDQGLGSEVTEGMAPWDESIASYKFEKMYYTSEIYSTHGISGFLNKYLGTSFTEHITVDGTLGILDEMFAEVVELFADPLTAGEATALQSTTALVLTAGLAPASALGYLSIAGASAMAYADYEYYVTQTMSIEEHIQMKALGAVISIMSIAISTVQTMAAIQSMKAYTNVSTRILAFAVTLLVAGIQIKGLLDSLASSGITFSDITSTDLLHFDTDNVGLQAGNAKEAFDQFAGWKVLRGGTTDMLEVVQGDPFEWLAGGSKYDAQLAGSMLYVGGNIHDTTIPNTKRINLSNEDRQSLFGSDGVYRTLEPIKMANNERADGIGMVARGNQLNRLVANYEDQLDLVNTKIDAYNNSIKDAANYDSYTAIKKDIESSTEELHRRSDLITSKAEQFGLM